MVTNNQQPGTPEPENPIFSAPELHMLGLLSLYREVFSNLQRNIWVLSIAMFINRSGSMVLLFTSLYMTKEFHFTIAQAGFVMSFTVWVVFLVHTRVAG